MAESEADFVKEMEALGDASKMHDTKAQPKEEPKKKAQRPAYRAKPLQPRLEQFATGIGMLVYMRCAHCGQLVAGSAHDLAEAYSEWADQSPQVRAILEKLVSGGAASKAVMTTLPIALGIAAHHNMLPAVLTRFAAGQTTEDVQANVTNGQAKEPPDGFAPPAA